MTNELTNELRSVTSLRTLSAEELANCALEHYFGESPPIFPINIFEVLKEFGVFYEFRELDRLEGAYSPDNWNEGTPAAILINVKRPYHRQRFTCAHELCHHIKDYDSPILCPLSNKDSIEVYADKFAGELLMPTQHFREKANELADFEGRVDPEAAFSICHFFGMSYTAVIWRLYILGYITTKPTPGFFKKAKASQKLGNVGHKEFLSDIIDHYKYFPQEKNSPLWIRYKNDLVFNDSRMEGLEIDINETSEILVDLRIHGESSEHFKSFATGERIEVIGHSFIYDYIIDCGDDIIPDRTEILYLHKLLYYLSTFRDEMGRFRETNNIITGSSISTTDYTRIEEEIFLTCKDIAYLVGRKHKMRVSEYLSNAVFIHHQITKIHPFSDGNGRISRAILNWLMRINDLPPMYIPYEEKSSYVDALHSADKGEVNKLNEYFLKRLLSSYIHLNDEFSLIGEEDYSIY